MKVIAFALHMCLCLPLAQATEPDPVLETGGTTPMPESWIDRDTGHRLTRLVPGGGTNRSFYFHNNPFVPAAGAGHDRMVFYREVDGANQLFSLDLHTREIEQLTDRAGVKGEIVGPTTRTVYYQCGQQVYATRLDDGRTRLVYAFPEDLQAGITTLNADETLLAGAISSPEEREIFRQFPAKGDFFNRVYQAKLPRTLFTLDVADGTLTRVYTERAWLNHIQFSPTDPDLLMFCHEGPWHKVDRIWTLRLGHDAPRLMHKRTMEMEIAGHEFFGRDGRTIWFDLQRPRGETFFLASVEIGTGARQQYAMTRDEWSIHFNQSPDQNLFAGDGGDPGQVARAEDGQWIYLFRTGGDRLISERLVNMAHHDYRLEPNVHVAPDGRSVIFRANFEGRPDIYAVEVQRAER
jgi:oligogalacturonide lyase